VCGSTQWERRLTCADVQIDTLVLGPLETNCYLLRAGTDCWVVDPAWPGVLPGRLRRAGLAPGRILLTHAHADHTAGAAELKGAWPDCRLCCPAGDAELLQDPAGNLSALLLLPLEIPPADELLRPGQTLELGRVRWEVLDTSGHTPGGVSYYCAQAGVVLTGDALFAGGIGRTDFPGGDASRLIGNIRRRLLVLPDATKVLAGHGPASTIGVERRTNSFLTGE
jgi:glyoxylase-like metal-dependent hydrolase (beta-lactamase superfamily II)